MENRREKFRKGLSTLYLPYYDALCGILSEEWQPYYGARTFAEQDLLWAQGRSSPGRIVTYAKGGQSAHNYGCATDFAYFRPDGSIDWGTDKWPEYGQAVEKVNAVWGGSFSKPDKPHNELFIQCSWSHILQVFKQSGLRAAMEKIEEAMWK